MKSQDVALLLKLICLKKRESEPWEYTVRGLEESTGISKSQVNSSLNRCVDVGLALKAASDGLMDVNRQALVDFVIHGLRFVFPARLGPPVRGMRTGLTAPVFAGALLTPGDLPPVWPYGWGDAHGQEVVPLFKSAPHAANLDKDFYRLLALADAIRTGQARERELAAQMLRAELLEDKF